MSKVNLCDICDFQGGSQPPKSQWITLQQDGYIRMLQIRDFTQPGKVKAEYVKLTNTTKCCLKDDILIARYGASLGKILTGLSGAYNVAMTKAVPNEAVISKKFLYYFLCSDTFQNCILNVGVRAAQAGFNKEDLSNIELYCPDLSIQNKICKILELVDVLINKSKLQLDELDLLVKSRFIEMFGDPVLNNKGWPVKKLKQLTSKISSGNTPKGGREVYVSEGITFFRSQNVWRNYFDMSDIAYIDEATHKKMADTSLKHGDLLITKTGRFNTENSSLGRTALFLGENDSANINGHVYLVRLKAGINHQFVLHILISNQFRDLIRKVCVGGIDKRQLNKNHIEDFPIIIPPLEQQEEYADFVQQVDKSKLAIQKSLDELETLKKSLMQQYFG